MSMNPKSTANMQFVGAAQEVSTSFLDLAVDSLNQHCSNWNNQSDPASYIFPPTFTYKNEDKSRQDIELVKAQFEQEKRDGVIQEEKELAMFSMGRQVTDLQSDDGEFVLFQAIWNLVQEKIQAPFLAIHSLNLGNLKKHFQTIFPNLRCKIQDKFKEMMREYDFVLIGPKIGIIVIEVKSSFFTKQRDFGSNNRRWPDHIVEGVKQLNSFDLEFFKDCSGIGAPLGKTRKILFTPNLEKTRLEGWLNNMEDLAKVNSEKLLASNGITLWFKEDLTNSTRDSLKPHPYSQIREMLEARGFHISQKIYESYGPLISGLNSVVILKNQPNICIERLSTSAAIMRDDAKLDTHDYLQQLSLNSTKPKKQKADMNLDTVSINVDKGSSKLILLNPEQRAALNGPERQFIAGGPGTGKTIIIHVKALQLLKDEKKILVFAAPSYRNKYQKSFDSYGYSKYEIISDANCDLMLPDCLIDKILAANKPLQITLDTLSEYVENVPEIRDWLTNFDAILIDDAFDVYDWYPVMEKKRWLFVMLVFSLARSCEFSSKVVWIAGDACSTDSIFAPIVDQIFKGVYFTCAILHRAMRSSVSVFKATHGQHILGHLAIKPSIGHNVPGYYESVHLQMPSWLQIGEQTHRVVEKFRDEGFNYGHMAVILGEDPTMDRSRMISIMGTVNQLRTDIERRFRLNGIPVDSASSHSLSSLTLDTFDNVSSLEWPIVVYVALLDSYNKGYHAAYYRYRGCSRATMILFEIIAEFP